MATKDFYRVLLRNIVHYIVLVALGIPLGLFFIFLVCCRRVHIRGYVRAVQLIGRGRVMIAANHPGMLETIFIPLLFFPLFLVRLRFFVWSVPDRRLLPSRMRWLFWLLRCITIDRSDRKLTKYTLRELTELLESDSVAVIHPEAGRTEKGDSFIIRGNRRMRSFISGVPALARSTNAVILPLWVSGTDVVLPVGTCFPHFLRSKITFSFGTPYRPAHRARSRSAESAMLADAILKS